MKLYKLTDENAQTYGGCQWGEGVTHTASGEGELCGPGWIHAYEHPLLAVLHNPIHGNFENPRLWECETTDENPLRDGQVKLGVRNLTTIREIPLPVVTPEQRVRYAILCGKAVYDDPAWLRWAEDWLSGKDRSAEAAAAAARAAARSAWSAAELAAESAWSAAESARAAAESARAAARAAKNLSLIAIATEAVSGGGARPSPGPTPTAPPRMP
jgi:hypothetical protein